MEAVETKTVNEYSSGLRRFWGNDMLSHRKFLIQRVNIFVAFLSVDAKPGNLV